LVVDSGTNKRRAIRNRPAEIASGGIVGMRSVSTQICKDRMIRRSGQMMPVLLDSSKAARPRHFGAIERTASVAEMLEQGDSVETQW
jgi:hypothetical protein